MKKILIATLTLAFLASCSSSEGQLCNNDACPSPSWTESPPALGAVGMAKGINVAMAKKLAVDNARHELARQIAAKVMGVLDQSAQQVVGANPGEITGHQYAEEITRTLHKQFLSGSRGHDFYRNCCNGDWVALVMIDREGLLEAANIAAKLAAEKILKVAEAKHKELSAKMEEILEKEYPNQ
jgi:hypothetical protein